MTEAFSITSLTTKQQIERQRAADELLIAAIFVEAHDAQGAPDPGALGLIARATVESVPGPLVP